MHRARITDNSFFIIFFSFSFSFHAFQHVNSITQERTEVDSFLCNSTAAPSVMLLCGFSILFVYADLQF
jgi:hypothetical protein